MSTERDQTSDEFIPVNQILNTKPQLGPIPGEQVIPWLIIAIVAYLVCQGVLGLDWWATGLIAVWGAATWWVLTGNESWRFLTKFHGTPNWTRGHLPYTMMTQVQKFVDQVPRHKRRTKKSRRTKVRQ